MTYDTIIKTSLPSLFNLDKLREEIAAAFGGRFVHALLTNSGTTMTAYLSGDDAGDQSVLEGVVAAHNPASLTAAQQEEQNRLNDFAALRDELAASTVYFQDSVDRWSLLTVLERGENQRRLNMAILRLLKVLGHLAR